MSKRWWSVLVLAIVTVAAAGIALCAPSAEAGEKPERYEMLAAFEAACLEEEAVVECVRLNVKSVCYALYGEFDESGTSANARTPYLQFIVLEEGADGSVEVKNRSVKTGFSQSDAGNTTLESQYLPLEMEFLFGPEKIDDDGSYQSVEFPGAWLLYREGGA